MIIYGDKNIDISIQMPGADSRKCVPSDPPPPKKKISKDYSVLGDLDKIYGA